MQEITSIPENALPAKEYACPKCRQHPPEICDNTTDFYKVKGEKYPKYIYPKKDPIFGKLMPVFNGEFSGVYWTEIHYCKKCKIEFHFRNGAP